MTDAQCTSGGGARRGCPLKGRGCGGEGCLGGAGTTRSAGGQGSLCRPLHSPPHSPTMYLRSLRPGSHHRDIEILQPSRLKNLCIYMKGRTHSASLHIGTDCNRFRRDIRMHQQVSALFHRGFHKRLFSNRSVFVNMVLDDAANHARSRTCRTMRKARQGNVSDASAC